jgi:hypothetical protein
MGKKITVTPNMIFKVARLELASHTVKELFKAELDGIRNGNMDTPAVKITEVNTNELAINASPVRSVFDSAMVAAPAIKASAGITHNTGQCA